MSVYALKKIAGLHFFRDGNSKVVWKVCCHMRQVCIEWFWPCTEKSQIIVVLCRESTTLCELLYETVSYFIIPRETRGYRFQLFRLSVCPSVRPSVCPASCSGHISESTQRNFFKFHIRIEHQWKVCNVVFSFHLMKKCESDRTLKTNENLRNIRPRVQAISPKVYIGVLLSLHIRIKHILKVCNVVFWIKLMKNCQSYRLLKIHKMR